MKILVTGGCGFIGRRLIKKLVKAHHEVVNIDAMTYASQVPEGGDGVKHILKPIGQESLKEAGIGFNAIIHLAAESHVDRSISGSSQFMETNIMGTYQMLEAARQMRCRFIHVSTDEVYGDTSSEVDEFYRCEPSSPYSASKAASDHLVTAWARTYKFKAIITRCSNNYGPGQNEEKLIPKVISNALSETPIPIYGNGTQIRNWIHVDDHCEAIMRVLDDGVHKIYNIATDDYMSNIDLVRLILDKIEGLTGKRNLKRLIWFAPDRPGHDHSYFMSANRITRSLEWIPRIRFSNGIEDTIKSYL